MILRPNSLAELAEMITCAGTRGEKVDQVDLSSLNRVLEHTPEDMTVTVEAGASLAAMQATLAQRGQWLPLDPADASLSVERILANNETGPRRFGYGTIRDYVIGMKVILADGQVIKSGGKVVKNVAGYDLQKAFIGSRGTLGVIVEATFKLRPIPVSQTFVRSVCGSLAAANSLIEAVLESPLTPIVLDLHNVDGPITLVLGFDGTREEVEWQLTRARELGVKESANLDYDVAFRKQPSVCKTSVLPSRIVETVGQLGASSFVARAGNGVIYHRGQPSTPPPVPDHLMKRLKDTFDPKHLFPDLSNT